MRYYNIAGLKRYSYIARIKYSCESNIYSYAVKSRTNQTNPTIYSKIPLGNKQKYIIVILTHATK